MTSNDTHSRTLELLESNDYFGMKPTQVNLLKKVNHVLLGDKVFLVLILQWSIKHLIFILVHEKVACLDDNDARLAVDPRNTYRIQTKPHGHGDVHSLLYSSGLLKAWLNDALTRARYVIVILGNPKVLSKQQLAVCKDLGADVCINYMTEDFVA